MPDTRTSSGSNSTALPVAEPGVSRLAVSADQGSLYPAGGSLCPLPGRLAPEPHGDVIGLVRGVDDERSAGQDHGPGCPLPPVRRGSWSHCSGMRLPLAGPPGQVANAV